MRSGRSGSENPSPCPLPWQGRGDHGIGFKSIAAFAVKFLVIYGALAASWPLCGSAYAFFLRESGNILFEAVGTRNLVRIRAYTSPDGRYDTVYSVRVDAGQARHSKISSRETGFQPTSLLIGLVVATPVNMRRRLWALFAGLVLVHAIVLARLATIVSLTPVLLSDTFRTNTFLWSVFVFIRGPALSCFVPVLIWLAVTVRREDAQYLVPSSEKNIRDRNAAHA